MLIRILSIGVGFYLILYVLLTRGLPVIFIMKMMPLLLIILVAFALIYAGISKD